METSKVLTITKIAIESFLLDNRVVLSNRGVLDKIKFELLLVFLKLITVLFFMSEKLQTHCNFQLRQFKQNYDHLSRVRMVFLELKEEVLLLPFKEPR